MSWTRDVTVSGGLPIRVFGDYYGGEALGFVLDDNEQGENAILNRTPELFATLDWMISDDARDYCDAQCANCGDWHIYGAEKDAGYEAKLRLLAANKYVNEKQKGLINEELAKLARKAAKKHHTKRRRSEFQEQRDRLALALIERDGYTCAECGAFENLTIDHVTPVSKGGSDELDNLRFLCRGCNSKKGDRTGA